MAMTHAYDKMYLEKARASLGCMLDFGVHTLSFDINTLWDMFLVSPLSKKFETGDISVIAGKSGIELALDITDSDLTFKKSLPSFKSEEYWTGWALAYYQWQTGLKFNQITESFSIDKIRSMYNPYHEMDIRQFVDKLSENIKSCDAISNLKRLRNEVHISQKELAELTDIPLRTIQQYEQKQKNINCAKSEYVVSLAKALYCSPEDILNN